MKKPFVIVLTGASSVGKKPIKDALMADPSLELHYTKSVTTRPKKDCEVDGVDYYFITHKEFKSMVKERQLIEFTEFGGYYYGIPRQQVDMLRSLGKNILIDTEAQGVGQVKLHFPDAVCIFIKPKCFEDLEKHIKTKYEGTDSVQERLAKAKVEMDLLPLFRNTVTVCDTDQAVSEIKEILEKELKEVA